MLECFQYDQKVTQFNKLHFQNWVPIGTELLRSNALSLELNRKLLCSEVWYVRNKKFTKFGQRKRSQLPSFAAFENHFHRGKNNFIS